MAKKKLIYIAGIGHSGSTALDLALALEETVMSGGQFNDITRAKVERIKDKKLRDFWDSVLSSASTDEAARFEAANRSLSREKPLLKMWLKKKARREISIANQGMIQAALTLSQKDILVDSSKNISRALGLTALDGVDVFFIHLTRDIRGFVNSVNKRKTEFDRPHTYLVPSLLWFLKNAAASLLIPRATENYVRISYEDLLHNPDKEINRIEDLIGIELGRTKAAFHGEMALRPDLAHGISGNRILHNREGITIDAKKNPRDGVYKSALYWYVIGMPCAVWWGYRR